MKTSKRNIILITLLFLTILTGFRLIWNSIHTISSHTKASQGVLDLRSYGSLANATFLLHGEWEFYPNQFVMPDSANLSDHVNNKKYIQVPGNWSDQFDEDSSDYQFGTYRLRIMTSQNIDRSYGLWFTEVASASSVFANGKLLATSGTPAEDYESFIPRKIPYSVSFLPESNEFEIIIQVSNSSTYSMGGITSSIKFGDKAAIEKKRLFALALQLMVCVIFLLNGFYAGIIYFIDRTQKVMIYFFYSLSAQA